MLVLTRKYQEKIRIGNDITITVLRTKGKAVRLGIEAPSTVPVIRGELQFENAAVAVQDSPAPATVANASRHRDAVGEPSWTTKSRPRTGSRGRAISPAAQVGHHRVAREAVSELMPRLVSGNAPLRALLDQRTTSL